MLITISVGFVCLVVGAVLGALAARKNKEGLEKVVSKIKKR